MSAAGNAMTPSFPHIEEALAAQDFPNVVHSTMAFLRENAPIYWSTTLGQWLVTSHRLAEEVLLHPSDFSSFGAELHYIERLPQAVREGLLVLEHHYSEPGLIHSDGDNHTRLRRAVSSSFTPKAVLERRRAIEQQVQELLERRVPEHGAFDLVDCLAFPLPVVVIAGVLGIPDSDLARFPSWSAHLSRFFSPPSPVSEYARDLDAVLVEWRGFVADLLDDRSANPSGDLLTIVSRAVDNGQINRDEAIAILVHMLQAGHETTRNLVSSMVYCILQSPTAVAALRKSPERITAAMEETLRLEPPADFGTRTCITGRELGGEWVQKGETIAVSISAANRDPERYDHPDDFDIDRDLSAGHLSFGRGIHACLGASLARMEAPIAVEAFLQRFPGARLRSSAPHWSPTRSQHGLRELWIEP